MDQTGKYDKAGSCWRAKRGNAGFLEFEPGSKGPGQNVGRTIGMQSGCFWMLRDSTTKKIRDALGYSTSQTLRRSLSCAFPWVMAFPTWHLVARHALNACRDLTSKRVDGGLFADRNGGLDAIWVRFDAERGPQASRTARDQEHRGMQATSGADEIIDGTSR